MASASLRAAALGAGAGLALLAGGVALRSLPLVHAPATVSANRNRSVTSAAPAAPAGPGAAAVDFVNAHDGWAIVGGSLCGYAPGDTSAGPPCAIVATTDGGEHWRQVFRTTRALTGLSFSDSLHGFAWGPDALLATANGGQDWQWRIHGRRPPSSLDPVAAAEAWGIVGGALVRSRDQGRSWSVADPGSTCTFSSVSFAGSRDGWAAGTTAQGVCLQTTHDGGHTWTPLLERLSVGPAASAFDAYVASLGSRAPAASALEARPAFPRGAVSATAALVSPGAGWLVLRLEGFQPNAFAVLRTTDAGVTWRYAWGSAGCLMGCVASGGGETPAFFLTGSTVWRWGPYGVVRSTDGGARWSGLPACGTARPCAVAGPPPSGALCAAAECGNSVTFVTAAIGWAAAPRGIFATRDGGETWRRQWPPTVVGGPTAAPPPSGQPRG